MSYSKRQVMLTLSYISYLGITFIGKDEKNESRISEMIENALKTWKPIKNEWKLVWGPAVFALPGTKLDDTMVYIVESTKTPSKYTVVIRGTNPFSLANWLIWDFQADDMKDWPFGDPKDLKPKISESTNFGLIILQGLRPSLGKNVKASKRSILEFFQDELKDDKKKALDITITGHSLGGALAPTFALWLKDIQDEELNKNTKISTVAFAGPTAGNKDFADYSNMRFEKNSREDYDRIANSKDIVPYAWNNDSLKKLVKIYCPIVPNPGLYFWIKWLTFTTKHNHYTQIQENPEILMGKQKYWLPPNYMLQALYQHVVGYPELLGMKKTDINWWDLIKSNINIAGRVSRVLRRE